MKYEDMTDKEKKYLCNGAGKKGLQGYLVPDWFGIFTEPSNRHDFDYWQGCSEEDKIIADRRYLDSLLNVSEYKDVELKNKRNFAIRWFLRKMAFKYYSAVMELGGNKKLGGFNYSDKKRTHMDLIHEMSAANNKED